jgi:hypothetical protein
MSRDDHMRRYLISTSFLWRLGATKAAFPTQSLENYGEPIRTSPMPSTTWALLFGLVAFFCVVQASGQDRLDRNRSVMRGGVRPVSQAAPNTAAPEDNAPENDPPAGEEPPPDPAMNEPAEGEAAPQPKSALRKPATQPSTTGNPGKSPATTRGGAPKKPTTSAATRPEAGERTMPLEPAEDYQPNERSSKTPAGARSVEPAPGYEEGDAPELLEEPWAEPLSGQCGIWVSAEYLMWWRRGSQLPALVSSSPNGAPAQDAGVLGAGGFVIYGDETVGDQARPGARLSFGQWLDCEQTRGWMVRTYFLETSVAQFDADQNDFPILARPFLDVTGVPEQNAFLVAFPNGSGNVSVRSESDVIGGDALWRQMIYVSPSSRVDLLLGYQFAHLDGSLQIDTVNDPNGVNFQVTDFFSTRNEFHGGALGLQFVYDRPGVRLDLMAKVGLGSMNQSVFINGQSNGAAGGLLAQATNMGLYSRSNFAAIPELGATLTWFLTESLEFSLGYSFIFFPHVVQPENAIDPDLAVNLSVPFQGDNRPTFVFDDSNYWVHGLNLGVTFRY